MSSHLIASIYFAPVKAERNYGGPYEMPAVPPGADPALLSVQDRVQIEEGPYQLGHGGRVRRTGISCRASPLHATS
jgi:hypothetical protein